MKPIFSRLDDSKTKSRKEIILFAVLFFAVTRAVSMLAVTLTARLYFLYGFDAMAALRFDGSIEGLACKAVENGVWPTVAVILLGAPLLEECAFRLGLSFKRRDAAVGLGAAVLFLVSRICGSWLCALAAGALTGAAVWFATSDELWNRLRPEWLKSATCISTVLFAMAHMFTMHGLSLTVLPYALLLCLVIFFSGAVFAYIRVNLGFRWGVAAHMLNNLPGALLLLSML